jgi:N,N'-diacetylchitobiose non-reducing end deacetylase
MEIKDLVKNVDITQVKSVLCVQPHPDDNEIGMGGTIKVLSSLGIKISYCTVSKGKGGSNELSSKELVELRQVELKEAGKSLGASTFYQLDLSDSHYPSEKEFTTKLVEVIREVKPDVVFTVDPYLLYESHPTHRKTGMAVLEACLFSSMKHFPEPDAINPPITHRVSAIGFYATAHPNTYIDITDTYDDKINAILKHKTQFDEQGAQSIKMYLDLLSLNNGKIKGTHRAESFKLLPMIVTHMMVESEDY